MKIYCFIYINILNRTGDIPGNYQQMATPPAQGSKLCCFKNEVAIFLQCINL